MNSSAPLDQETLDLLGTASTATITTQLFKHGFRQQFLVGLMPSNPGAASFVGIARTLRFIPSREDKDFDLRLLHERGENNLQWEAVEATQPGEVLVIDSRNDISAASGGDMLMTRLMRRGASAAVTDGAWRDGVALSELPFPTYARANTATTRPASFRAADMQVPIGCCGVAVYPGDVIVSDGNGVVVVPRSIADVLARDCASQEQLEMFLYEKIDAGASLWGTYPPNEETLRLYAEHKAAQDPKANG